MYQVTVQCTIHELTNIEINDKVTGIIEIVKVNFFSYYYNVISIITLSVSIVVRSCVAHLPG